MKHYLLVIYNFMCLFGIDPIKMINSVKRFPGYISEFQKLKKLKSNDSLFNLELNYPCLYEKNTEGGNAKGHYFHQDLYVARRIFVSEPEKHVDIGSRVDGFIAHVASFREIEALDIRPLNVSIPNIKFIQCDIMSDAAKSYYDYTDSLSCLHALEHFGLGRYGDQLDYYGHLKGFSNLEKIVKPGGKFYFSVPIGPQRIEFNAHRVFSVSYLIKLISNNFIIDSYSYVDDKGEFYENIDLNSQDINNNFGCHYGCGIFELIRKNQ